MDQKLFDYNVSFPLQFITPSVSGWLYSFIGEYLTPFYKPMYRDLRAITWSSCTMDVLPSQSQIFTTVVLNAETHDYQPLLDALTARLMKLARAVWGNGHKQPISRFYWLPIGCLKILRHLTLITTVTFILWAGFGPILGYRSNSKLYTISFARLYGHTSLHRLHMVGRSERVSGTVVEYDKRNDWSVETYVSGQAAMARWIEREASDHSIVVSWYPAVVLLHHTHYTAHNSRHNGAKMLIHSISVLLTLH